MLVCFTRRGREPPSGQKEMEMRVKIVCLHKDINAHLNGGKKRNTKQLHPIANVCSNDMLKS